MAGFVAGLDRGQATLLPECLEDWIDESNPVRAVDVFVDALELRDLGFDGVDPAATGRPAYHPSAMLKLYIYGYLNRVQSSRRLEREAGRNLEVMWLTGRLVPDHKTIADFRKDNGPAIKKVCAQFVALCRKMGLLAKASVAIDGSKFKAVNSRDNNFTKGKMERRLAQIEESVARYLSQLDTADRRTAAGEATGLGISVCAALHVMLVAASATTQFKLLFVPSLIARCRTLPGAIVKSDLPFGQPQHQTVELWRDLDLARQPAVGLTFGGGAIEQRVLVISDRSQPTDPLVIHINMAGGAQGAAAAFRNDSVDAVKDRSAHGAVTNFRFDTLDAVVRMNEGDGRHLHSLRQP